MRATYLGVNHWLLLHRWLRLSQVTIDSEFTLSVCFCHVQSINQSTNHSKTFTTHCRVANESEVHFDISLLCFFSSYLFLYQKVDCLASTALRNCCNRINEQNLYASSLSLASTTRDRDVTVTSSSSSSWSSSPVTSRRSAVSATSNCSTVISSIDTELLEVQRRLVFPRHIQVSTSASLPDFNQISLVL